MAFKYGDHGFRLTFPDDWTDQTIYSFKGPEDSGVQHGLLLTIDRNPATDDLARYAQEQIAVLGDTLSGVVFLNEYARTLPAGMPAYESVYKWSPSTGKILWQRQVWILAQGEIYSFTASFSKKTFKTIGKEIEAIIDSFLTQSQIDKGEPTIVPGVKSPGSKPTKPGKPSIGQKPKLKPAKPSVGQKPKLKPTKPTTPVKPKLKIRKLK